MNNQNFIENPYGYADINNHDNYLDQFKHKINEMSDNIIENSQTAMNYVSGTGHKMMNMMSPHNDASKIDQLRELQMVPNTRMQSPNNVFDGYESNNIANNNINQGMESGSMMGQPKYDTKDLLQRVFKYILFLIILVCASNYFSNYKLNKNELTKLVIAIMAAYIAFDMYRM
jgi:hypothetical protein